MLKKSVAATGAGVALSIFLSGALFAAEASTDKPEVRTTAKKPVKMNEPMRGEMKKDGMTMGDMKAAAEKKDAEMKKMMEQEAKSTPQSGKK